jgi:hypothetical protein
MKTKLIGLLLLDPKFVAPDEGQFPSTATFTIAGFWTPIGVTTETPAKFPDPEAGLGAVADCTATENVVFCNVVPPDGFTLWTTPVCPFNEANAETVCPLVIVNDTVCPG